MRGYLDENSTALLNLEDVARGLGFTQTKNNVEYVRWETVTGYLTELGFSQHVGKDVFIPEETFYDLCFKASNETARAFQKKVTHEILPTIRKTGGYIANEDAFIETYLPYVDESIKQMFKSNLAVIREQNRKIDMLKTQLNESETFWTIMKFNQHFGL